jgi:hypothetical protein
MVRTMSRGVKDLRALINDSRQSCVTENGLGTTASSADDEKICYSDGADTLSNHSGFSALTIASLPFRQEILLNGGDFRGLGEKPCRLPSPDISPAFYRLRYDNPQPLTDGLHRHSASPSFSFPKNKPLPAVSPEGGHDVPGKPANSISKIHNKPSHSTSAETTDRRSISAPNTCLRTSTRFDDIFKVIDSSVILIWLEQVNRSISDISGWCHEPDNFIHFMHFWLSEFPEHQKHEILKLEYCLLRERITLAFGGKAVSSDKFESFLQAVLHEYPDDLLRSGQQSSYLFLDHLEILVSSKRRRSCLLADVHYSVADRQHFETLLAVRSFALISIWSAILDQFRSGEDAKRGVVPKKTVRPSTARVKPVWATESRSATTTRPCTARPITARKQDDSQIANDEADTYSNETKAFDAVRLGYVDVVQYLLDTNKVSYDVCDSDHRSLLFFAAVSSQPLVIQMLLCQTSCDVNMPADSGNTPLHVAANRGDAEVTRQLLAAKNVNVDVPNADCDNATPLLLAALHGHTEVIKLLIDAGADVSKTMGNGQTALDIAQAFDHTDVVDILQKCLNRLQ